MKFDGKKLVLLLVVVVVIMFFVIYAIFNMIDPGEQYNEQKGNESTLTHFEGGDMYGHQA